jgi:hypothetical protein
VVLVEQRGTVRLAAPLVPDPVQQRAMTEPPTDAAVDLANEARYLDEGGTGPCNGCPRPLRPGQEPDFTPGGPAAPGEHERPYEPPRIHIR